MLSNFLSTLSFLSRIPIQLQNPGSVKINYFPATALILTLILILAEKLFSVLFPLEITALLLLILYIYLTGALHLDGLGDFCDGFFAGRDRAKTVEIMHDPNSGIFAVISIILILFLKYLLFKEILLQNNFESVIIMSVLARFILTWVVVFSRASTASLLGKSLKEKSEKKDLIYSTLTTIIIFLFYSYFVGTEFIYPMFFSLFIIFLMISSISGWSRKKLGGITGDIQGTIIELSEVIFLLTLIMF